jgi:hypothetical protein
MEHEPTRQRAEPLGFGFTKNRFREYFAGLRSLDCHTSEGGGAALAKYGESKFSRSTRLRTDGTGPGRGPCRDDRAIHLHACRRVHIA